MTGAPQKDPVDGEYARLAERYDRRWSFYVDATIRETLKRLHPFSGNSVLDVGCGTGVLLIALARAFPEISLAGIDLSQEMLEIAQTKLGSRADLRQGRAEHLPFRNDAFDLIVSTSVLHYLATPDAALSEMHRVLKPGGRVVITDWCHDYLACRIYGVLSKAFSRSPVRIYGGEECRRLVADAGLTTIRLARYKIDWLWGLMTVSATKSDHREAVPTMTRSASKKSD